MKLQKIVLITLICALFTINSLNTEQFYLAYEQDDPTTPSNIVYVG